ncbi:hypothetical protein Ahy_B03g065708 isoform I [Arachis hypogaea]|uniref:Photolyase/cryptochrome alpha/beta domain-containing protein n=1 Tax=Arachis hypogaea TaxID=3818 RepID=A0A445A2B7_ARAHY|nr:hypothetical protein Ahy_B03g065708 isoform I [Arachis hypogaea]
MASAASLMSLQPGRIRTLKEGSKAGLDAGMGPVVYWMFRDQRVKDNWALIHAVHQANKSNVPVAVVFNLFDQFLGAKSRHLGFMLRGLRRVSDQLHQTLQIPFFLLRVTEFPNFFNPKLITCLLNFSKSESLLNGEAEETVPKFLSECGASMLVTDFSPLREVRRCKEEICKKVNESLTVHEVDAHNIVPLWVASEKLEYSAKTIRGKINKKLSEYLIDFPTIEPQTRKWTITKNHSVDWDDLIADVLRKGTEVPEVNWCEPGEDAAMEVLMGSKNGFLTKRLRNYSADRNNPCKPTALSGLSPYLHFGQISAQRCALEARKLRSSCPQVSSYLI